MIKRSFKKHQKIEREKKKKHVRYLFLFFEYVFRKKKNNYNYQMASNSSLNLDKDYANIVKWMNWTYDANQSVQSRSQPIYPPTIAADIAPERFHYPYLESPESSPLFRVTNDYKHPDVVTNKAQHAQNRVFLSVFPEISLAYCIVDNSFLYWKIGETRDDKVFELQMKGTEIRDAILAAPKDKIFHKKNIKTMIVIATDATFAVFPIGVDSPLFSKEKTEYENAKSFFDHNPKIFADCQKYNITKLTSSSLGQIFAGTASGVAYSIYYNKNDFNSSYVIKFVSHPKEDFLSKSFHYVVNRMPFPSFISGGAASPIIDMAYDETGRILMCIHEKDSYVDFFRIVGLDGYRIMFVDDIFSDEDRHLEGEQLIKAIAIPRCEGSQARFVAISNKGRQFFYMYAPDILQDDFIMTCQDPVEQQTAVNPQDAFVSYFDQEYVLPDAFAYSLGYSAFLTKSCLYLVSSSDMVDSLNLFQKIPIPYAPLTITFDKHLLFNQQEVISFRDPLFWQHILDEVPKFYLITVHGITCFSFLRPADRLKSMIEESKGNYTKQLRMWMEENQTEGGATCLLLASDPSQQGRALFVLSQFAKEHLEINENIVGNIGPSCQSFIIRVARFLDPIWNAPIFTLKQTYGEKEPGFFNKFFSQSDETSHEEKYEVNPIFQEVGTQSLIEKLKTLDELIVKYIKTLRTIIDQVKNDQQNETADEIKFLYELKNYISETIETITFIQILIDQKKRILTDALKELIGTEYGVRLTEAPFGYFDPNNTKIASLFESLRELATKLITAGTKGGKTLPNNHIKTLIKQKCPNFFNSEDEELILAVLELNNCSEGADAGLVQKIIDVILSHIIRPINLKEVCNKLTELKMYKGVIDIALRRAAAIDPSQRALSWYKDGCKDDPIGAEFFDKRYRCYERIFDIINKPTAFDKMVATNDELFHICLYQYVIERGHIDSLLSIDTHFIIPYLKEYHPNELWRFYEKHEQYDEAAKQLRDNTMMNDSTPLDQRIESLSKVVEFAKRSKNDKDARSAQLQYNLALIQKELMTSTEQSNTKLLDQQTLLDKCCSYKRWDLVLRILGCVPVEGDEDKQVSIVWSKMLYEQFAHQKLDDVGSKISKTIHSIDKNSNVLKGKIVVPILENFKKNMKNGSRPLWCVETLLDCGCRKEDILDAYRTLIKQKSQDKEMKAEFIYCVYYIGKKGVSIPAQDLAEYRDWFVKNATGFYFYKNAQTLFKDIQTQ